MSSSGRAAVLVAAAAATLVAAPATARAPGNGPTVTAMVVGQHGTLVGARAFYLPFANVTIPGAGRCLLENGTPLGVLEASRRRHLLSYRLHPESTCTPQRVFVISMGGQANRGDGGWVYKVNGRLGTTSAADPSGPFGNGSRLRSTDRVLWFYCLHAARCQATLAVNAPAGPVAAGAPVLVTVTQLDDGGHASAAAAATVSLASMSARTDAGGHATLTAPATPGRYQLAASATGLVPSFPQTVAVR